MLMILSVYDYSFYGRTKCEPRNVESTYTWIYFDNVYFMSMLVWWAKKNKEFHFFNNLFGGVILLFLDKFVHRKGY